MIRGAFGTIFRRLACQPECDDPASCTRRDSCAYARIFEPTALETGPSGLVDLPRPYVFRAAHLDGRTLSRSEGFHFDLHLFCDADSALRYFIESFAQLAVTGIGPGRGKARLTTVLAHTRDGEWHQIYDGGGALPEAGREAAIEFPLVPGDAPVGAVRVEFLTPTEIKQAGQVLTEPPFHALFGRIRDRISNLRALYGPGPLPIDHHAVGERAKAVELTRCDLHRQSFVRRSTHTGQVHPIGGLVGVTEYRGDLTEFWPYLKLAEWTGVGRHTVWGKGVIAVSRPAGETLNPVGATKAEG